MGRGRKKETARRVAKVETRQDAVSAWEPPADFDAEARALFFAVRDTLAKATTVFSCDRAVLEDYVRARTVANRALKELAGVPAGSKEAKQLADLAHRMTQTANSLLRALGLCAEAARRRAAEVMPVPETEGDRMLLELLASRGL